jgi:hypothetical protein
VFNKTGIGLWLVATYWLGRSGAVLYLVKVAHATSEISPRIVGLINFLGPFMWIPHFRSNLCLVLAPVSALIGICAGIGLLLHQKWALTIVGLDRIIPMLYLIIFLPIVSVMDKGELFSSINASSLKTADIVCTLLMLVYLTRPNVRCLFGIT